MKLTFKAALLLFLLAGHGIAMEDQGGWSSTRWQRSTGWSDGWGGNNQWEESGWRNHAWGDADDAREWELVDPGAIPAMNRSSSRSRNRSSSRRRRAKGAASSSSSGLPSVTASEQPGSASGPDAVTEQPGSAGDPTKEASSPTASEQPGSASGPDAVADLLACMNCKVGAVRSSFMLKGDWQGKLWVQCFDCWSKEEDGSAANRSPQVFKKLAKQSWRKRHENARQALMGRKDGPNVCGGHPRRG